MKESKLLSVNYRAKKLSATPLIIMGLLLGLTFIYATIKTYQTNNFTVYSFLFFMMGILLLIFVYLLMPKKCKIIIYSDSIFFNPETLFSLSKQRVSLSFSNIKKVTFIKVLYNLSFEDQSEVKYDINLNGLHHSKIKHILHLLRRNGFTIHRIK